MKSKLKNCSAEDREVLLRADQILRIRLGQQRPENGDGIDLFDRFLLQIREEDARILRQSIPRSSRTQAAILRLHRDLNGIQGRYQL